VTAVAIEIRTLDLADLNAVEYIEQRAYRSRAAISSAT
jgi:hypothetical protein